MAKTQRERDEDARKVKLDRIKEQVEEGSLVIRQMTAKERKLFASRRSDEGATPTERKKAAAANARRRRNRQRAEA